jgi:hypothetical protein
VSFARARPAVGTDTVGSLRSSFKISRQVMSFPIYSANISLISRLEFAIPLVIARGVAEVHEELLSIAQELLAKALARISELEQAQTLNEEMIERAVAKALGKARIAIGGDGQ